MYYAMRGAQYGTSTFSRSPSEFLLFDVDGRWRWEISTERAGEGEKLNPKPSATRPKRQARDRVALFAKKDSLFTLRTRSQFSNVQRHLTTRVSSVMDTRFQMTRITEKWQRKLFTLSVTYPSAQVDLTMYSTPKSRNRRSPAVSRILSVDSTCETGPSHVARCCNSPGCRRCPASVLCNRCSRTASYLRTRQCVRYFRS